MAALFRAALTVVLIGERVALVGKQGTILVGTPGSMAPSLQSVPTLRGRSAVLIVDTAELETGSDPIPAVQHAAQQLLARRKLDGRFPGAGYLKTCAIERSAEGALAISHGVERAPVQQVIDDFGQAGIEIVAVLSNVQTVAGMMPVLAKSAELSWPGNGLLAIWMPGGIRIWAFRGGQLAVTRLTMAPMEEIGTEGEAVLMNLITDLRDTWGIVRRADDKTIPWTVALLPPVWCTALPDDLRSGKAADWQPRLIPFPEAARRMTLPQEDVDCWSLLAALAQQSPADNLLPEGQRLWQTSLGLTWAKRLAMAGVLGMIVILTMAVLTARQNHLDLTQAQRLRVSSGSPPPSPSLSPVPKEEISEAALTALLKAAQASESLALRDWLTKLAGLQTIADGLVTREIEFKRTNTGVDLIWKLESSPNAPEISQGKLVELRDRLGALRDRLAALPGVQKAQWKNNPFNEKTIDSTRFAGQNKFSLELTAQISAQDTQIP